MARRPARWAVAAGVAVAALASASVLDGTAAPVRVRLVSAATTTAAPDPAGPGVVTAARSPYERRHLLARQDSLDLDPPMVVVGVEQDVARPEELAQGAVGEDHGCDLSSGAGCSPRPSAARAASSSRPWSALE